MHSVKSTNDLTKKQADIYRWDVKECFGFEVKKPFNLSENVRTSTSMKQWNCIACSCRHTTDRYIGNVNAKNNILLRLINWYSITWWLAWTARSKKLISVLLVVTTSHRMQNKRHRCKLNCCLYCWCTAPTLTLFFLGFSLNENKHNNLPCRFPFICFE